MRIGVFSDPFATTMEQMEEDVALVQRSKSHTYWMSQTWRFDSLTLIPTLARTAPNAEFATSVVQSYLRHPMALALQALTVSELTKGHLTLGIGLAHKPVIEGVFEIPFDKPARHMREYLNIVQPLLEHKSVDFSGETVSYHGKLQVSGAPSCQVMLAALGPKMLELCGSRTQGTITWMTGANTIADYIKPTIDKAAESAGRDTPRIATLLPIVVTDDEKAGREIATSTLKMHRDMPSYRAMLDKSGFKGPQDYALIGNDEKIMEGLLDYAKAGVTDCGILIGGSDDYRQRGFELVEKLQGQLS